MTPQAKMREAVSEEALVARVEADRHRARVELLLDTLRSLARNGDAHYRPTDSIGQEDARHFADRQEAWHAGHDAGIVTGEWAVGNIAQDALDEWERTA